MFFDRELSFRTPYDEFHFLLNYFYNNRRTVDIDNKQDSSVKNLVRKPLVDNLQARI